MILLLVLLQLAAGFPLALVKAGSGLLSLFLNCKWIAHVSAW